MEDLTCKMGSHACPAGGPLPGSQCFTQWLSIAISGFFCRLKIAKVARTPKAYLRHCFARLLGELAA